MKRLFYMILVLGVASVLSSMFGTPDAQSQQALVTAAIQLTDTDRERIRLEEIYRQEVRKALGADRSVYDRIAEVLNAPFTLWFLSSVVLSLWTWVYTLFREASEKRRTHRDKLTNLLTELRTRLIRVCASVDGWQKGHVSWVVLEEAKEGVFPEFKNRDFLSLAVEIGILLPNVDEPKQLMEYWKRMLQEPKKSARQDVEELLTTLDGLIDAITHLTSGRLG